MIEKTFTKNNFKSPKIYLLWIIFIIILILLIYYSIKNEWFDGYIVSVLLFIFLMLLFVIGFKTKIIITKEGVIEKSIFSTRKINWNDAKTVGVYKLNRYQIRTLKRNEFSKKSIFYQNFIFISSKPNFQPQRSTKQDKDFITFHWREEAWIEINKHLNLN